MMRFLFAVLFSFALASPVRAEGFMSAFEDVPLQDGLVVEDPFSFDTEDVRIIEQYVVGDGVAKDDFVDFYSNSLKQLGWMLSKKADDSLLFRREDEQLSVSIEAEDPLIAVFSLRPLGK